LPQSAQPLPSDRRALATSPQGKAPRSKNLGAEASEAMAVRGDSVVRVVSTHHRIELLPLYFYGQVALPKEILADQLQLRPHSFLRGAPDKQELPVPRLPADVREAEEVEGFRPALPD
jgi:hypothetical protein